tara:strand:- start:3865 stop:4251 length:387 start_codon:yes stop_codon:yes gene_type:complete
MKIAFKRKHLNINLFYGLLFILTRLITLKSNQNRWYDIFSFLLPILFVTKYFLLKHNKYLTIDKGMIKINSLFGKQVKMSEINTIEKYAGKYIIQTDNKKLTIDTHIIEKKSLIELNAELENVNIKWV